MPRRQNRFSRPEQGFSLVEILVVAGLGVVLLSLVLAHLQSTAREGSDADARTKGWHTYSRLSAMLRFDLLQARRVQVPDDKTLEIETLECDPDFHTEKRLIVWKQDKNQITRQEGGRSTVFDFSEALGRQESLFLRFTRNP